MRKLLYTLHFTGKMSATGDRNDLLRATGTATSCVLSTTIGPGGIESDVQARDGDLAYLDSALRVTGPNHFEEDGTITFGDDSDHQLRFATAGPGHLVVNPDSGKVTGTARWEIEGGKGQFDGAEGFIASNFTLNGQGELAELHCGMIFVRE
jgi:hypothetical protein